MEGDALLQARPLRTLAERDLADKETERDQRVAALFYEHYDPMRRLAYVMLGDGDAAEEIVMEAFAKALTGWRSFQRVEWPPAYLRQMVVNACRSRMRRRAIENRVNSFIHHRDEQREKTFDVEEHGLGLDVWEAVRTLPERQRTCVVLRYLEGLTEPEIAQTLDCPLGTVKSQLSRARARLADHLGADFMTGERG
ncbi:MAG TPA: SigE family RNA polymerase sigma factor [Actinomycetota bacterium]|nr:SigE family RNA polymerase sigma factor [Actinomycetota bacterium]